MLPLRHAVVVSISFARIVCHSPQMCRLWIHLLVELSLRKHAKMPACGDVGVAVGYGLGLVSVELGLGLKLQHLLPHLHPHILKIPTRTFFPGSWLCCQNIFMAVLQWRRSIGVLGVRTPHNFGRWCSPVSEHPQIFPENMHFLPANGVHLQSIYLLT